MLMKKRIGLIVNPIAGMGGKVGLKGTDGSQTLEKAIAIGAQPESPRRAAQALERLSALKDKLEVLAYPGGDGRKRAVRCRFRHDGDRLDLAGRHHRRRHPTGRSGYGSGRR